MVRIAVCSKHETFGHCINCDFDSLKAERDALRAELAEQRRDSARDAQELARCHQIELTKLRAEIESYSAAHRGQFDRIFQLISEVDCFREALKEITATVKSYTNKDELDNCCDWGGNCQAGTMGSVFDSVLKTISKLQSKGM